MNLGVSLSGFAAAEQALDAIRFEYEGDTVYVCGPTVNYAIYNELGTSKMDARPFARPAAERVQQNLGMAERFVSGSGEAALVRAVALAVEDEMKRIVRQKGIYDTGTLHASISIQEVE